MKDARPTRPGRGPSAISYVQSNVGSVTGSLIHRESRRFSPFPLLYKTHVKREYFKRVSLNAWFQSLRAYRFIIDKYYISFAEWIVIIRENRKSVGIKKRIHNKAERGKFAVHRGDGYIF